MRAISGSSSDFAGVVGQLERTGCIADYTHIWWDVRPHPRLGTVELRICDAVQHPLLLNLQMYQPVVEKLSLLAGMTRQQVPGH